MKRILKTKGIMRSLLIAATFAMGIGAYSISNNHNDDNNIVQASADTVKSEIYVKIDSAWCMNGNQLDTTGWGGDGSLYACFYTVMPTNVNNKKTDDYAAEAWPGTRLTTHNDADTGVFSFCSVTVPSGAVAVCFNAGDTGSNTHCRNTVQAIPLSSDSEDTFFVNTNYRDINPFDYGRCQTGDWGILASDKAAYMIGSGSFTGEGKDWTIDSGMKLLHKTGYNGVILDQYFEEGDIFTIMNEDEDEFLYTDITIGASYVTQTVQEEKNGKITCSFLINDGRSGYLNWWRSESTKGKIRVITSGSSIPSHNETIDILNVSETRGDNVKYPLDIYSDITTITFKRIYLSNGVYVEDTADNHSFSESLSNWEATSYDWSVNYSGYWEGDYNYIDKTVRETGYMMKFNENGFYNIRLSTSNEIQISPSTFFVSGNALYLDISDIEEWEDNQYYLLKCRSTISYGQQYTYGHIVHNHGRATTLIEFEIPLLSYGKDYPDRIQFMTQNDGILGVRSVELTADYSKNLYVLSGEKQTYEYLGDWDDFITNEVRAESYFASYFNECVQCDGLGGMTVNRWDEAKDEFEGMCYNAQNIVINSKADENGTPLEFAMSKYDFIVFRKQYYSDYMNRASSPNVTHYNPNSLAYFEKDAGFKGTVIAVYIISSIATLGFVSFVSINIAKSKKKQHK